MLCIIIAAFITCTIIVIINFVVHRYDVLSSHWESNPRPPTLAVDALYLL